MKKQPECLTGGCPVCMNCKVPSHIDCGINGEKCVKVGKSGSATGCIALTMKQLVSLYNNGYGNGHNDTVEGCYTDILPVDSESYHADMVEEWLKEQKAI